MNDEISYGSDIKAARVKAGLTQKELAQKAGLAEITIRQYETNKREPRTENLKKIASALNIPVSELLGSFVLTKMDKLLEDMRTAGLCQLEPKEDYDIVCIDEDYIISLVKQLNDDGLGRICYHLEDLIKIPKYRKTDTPEE